MSFELVFTVFTVGKRGNKTRDFVDISVPKVTYCGEPAFVDDATHHLERLVDCGTIAIPCGVWIATIAPRGSVESGGSTSVLLVSIWDLDTPITDSARDFSV
jgi:hypothetical protein